MKKILRRLINGAFNIITIALIMASPLLAIVYSSELTALAESHPLNKIAVVVGEDLRENYPNRPEQESERGFAFQAIRKH